MKLQHTLNLLFDGMQSVRRTSFLTAAAALALAGTALAQSHQIGLKMGINAGSGVQNTSTNGVLLPTDSAGAFPQVNWNVFGQTGDNATNSFGTNSFPIYDSNGDDTHVSINWDATGRWAQTRNPDNTGAPQGTPDANLMNGYCDSGGNANLPLTNSSSIYGQSGNNKPMVFIAGLQAWLATEGASYYDVVVYGDGDATAGRTWEYWLQNASQGSTTGPLTNIVFGTDLTTHSFVCDRANFVSTLTYVEEPSFSHGNWVPINPGLGGGTAGWGAVLGNSAGNYIVFPSLSADSFVLRTEEFRGAGGTLRSPINAIQIIPRTSAVPPDVGPLPPSSVYAGGTATFRALVAGVAPITYQWQKNGAPLSDGGNISGSSTATLKITGVSGTDVANYAIVATNPNGASNATAPLSLASYVSGSFAEEIATNNPVAYWRLNDTGDPSTNETVALDYVGGFNGTYGLAALSGYNGVQGPQPPQFPGFESGHAALQSANGTIRSWVIAPPLHLYTNTVTMCAWVNPSGAEPASSGILFSRTTNNDVCGLGIGGTANNPVNAIGYTWNNNSATYNFASGIAIPSNMWSFVGVVVTPSNATLFVYNTNGLFSIVNPVTNTIGAFNGLTCIGDDPSSGSTPQGRAFSGQIADAAVFSHALPPIEIYNLYKKALHEGAIPPVIVSEPQSEVLFTGRTARFTVQATGDPFLPLTFQWRKNGVNLSNGGNVSGATTSTLTLTSVSASDIASYDVVVANVAGNATGSAASLNVVAPPASFSPYETGLQALNPLHYWRLNETNGSPYAYDYWGGNIATNIPVVGSVAGPIPPDFPGLDSTNTAFTYDGFTAFTDTGTLITDHLPAFTVFGWFNAAGPIGLRIGLFGQDDATEFGFHGQDPALPTGQGLLGIWTPNGGATYLSQANITPGQWYFTAATGDGTNLSLYLFTTNGSGGAHIVYSTTSAVTTNYGVGTGTPFHIGGGGILDVSSNYFTGTIDEVAVFNHALSAGQLSTLFATAIGLSGLAPQITAEPISETIYAGRTATFSVNAIGSAPLAYQWRKNGTPLSDGGNISGSSTATLSIGQVSANDQGNYDVVINNASGSATSTAATLGVVTPVPGSFESQIITLNPVAYYRLNETNDPTLGTAIANDYFGGHSGTYGSSSSNGFYGILGPVPPGDLGFEPNNYAVLLGPTIAGSVTNDFGTLNTNTATFTMWIYPMAAEDPYAGLEINRGGSNPGGFGYTGGHLGYTWNNNNGNTWGATWTANLVPPSNQWSFVALVVTPTNAVTYMTDPANPATLLSATATVANVVEAKSGTWYIGSDTDGATRTFIGIIDEVGIFQYAMTPGQLQQLYLYGYSASPVTLRIQQSGANAVLTWGNGVLQSASQVQGPYTDLTGATSPYSVPANAAQQCFRVRTH